MSPDGRLICLVGDRTDGLLVDAMSGETISDLKGHLDYSFACAWSPNGLHIATGNQDKSTRLYDLRNTSRAFKVLGNAIGATRSLKFSPNGRLLAVAEPADFVHIYDSRSDYTQAQTIEFFGEIAGTSFTPDSQSFYIANADDVFGGLFEFESVPRSHTFVQV